MTHVFTINIDPYDGVSSLQQRHEVLLNRNAAVLMLPNALLVIPVNSYRQLTSLFAVYTCLYYLLLLLLLQNHL